MMTSDASDQPIVHTPGPWTLGDENNQCCEVVLGNKHNLTVDLDRQDSNTGMVVIDRDEMLANARLITAAPDLLEACKRYLDAMDRYGHPDKTDRLMRAAIEKATGEKVV